MKNLFYVFGLVLLITSCDTTTSQVTDTDKPIPLNCAEAPQDGVLYNIAQADIERYKKYLADNHMDSNFVRAFTMESMDFIEGLGLPIAENKKVQFHYVRLYIGLNDSMQFKLYVTPVVDASLKKGSERAGKDSILCRSVVMDATRKQVSQEGYMLDFASPCPNTCPDK